MKILTVRNKFKNKTTPWMKLYDVDSLEEALQNVKEQTLQYELKFTLDIQETTKFIFITVVFL